MQRTFGVAVDPAQVVNCIGTKELVASLPHVLRLRDPSRDTVLYPAVSYPTYAMGAELGRLPGRARPARTTTGTSTSRPCRRRTPPGRCSCG